MGDIDPVHFSDYRVRPHRRSRMLDRLGGWTLAGAALAAAAAGWLLYLVGVLGEERAGDVVVLGIVLAGALAVVRPAAALGADPLGRALAVAAAVGTLAVGGLTAFATISPGTPIAQGDLAAGGALPLPAGAARRVRVLVHAHLPPEGMPRIGFRFAGGAAPLEGEVERIASTARVGRGARTTVTRDHSSTWVSGRLAPDASALRLERLSGSPVGPLHVAVYPERLPLGWLVGLTILIVALAAVADARLGVKDQGAAAAGVVLAFAIFVTQNATPDAAVGESLASLAVGLFAGGIGGWLAGFVARRLVPARRTARGARVA
jgi:hypothetical protein